MPCRDSLLTPLAGVDGCEVECPLNVRLDGLHYLRARVLREQRAGRFAMFARSPSQSWARNLTSRATARTPGAACTSPSAGSRRSLWAPCCGVLNVDERRREGERLGPSRVGEACRECVVGDAREGSTSRNPRMSGTRSASFAKGIHAASGATPTTPANAPRLHGWPGRRCRCGSRRLAGRTVRRTGRGRRPVRGGFRTRPGRRGAGRKCGRHGGRWPAGG